MAKRCPKRFVLGFTESGKFYFYSKTLQQLMSSGYVYLCRVYQFRYTRVRTYSAWTSVLLVRNKGQYQSLVKRNSSTQSRFFYLHKCLAFVYEKRNTVVSPAFFVYRCEIIDRFYTIEYSNGCNYIEKCLIKIFNL